MELYQWLNKAVGEHDIFAVLDDTEFEKLLRLSGFAATTSSLQGKYFYFLNTDTKTITPVPFLALAFGGQYNDDPPYGDRIEMADPDLSIYTMVKSRWAK